MHYPEVYILQGGYADFHGSFPVRSPLPSSLSRLTPPPCSGQVRRWIPADGRTRAQREAISRPPRLPPTISTIQPRVVLHLWPSLVCLCYAQGCVEPTTSRTDELARADGFRLPCCRAPGAGNEHHGGGARVGGGLELQRWEQSRGRRRQSLPDVQGGGEGVHEERDGSGAEDPREGSDSRLHVPPGMRDDYFYDTTPIYTNQGGRTTLACPITTLTPALPPPPPSLALLHPSCTCWWILTDLVALPTHSTLSWYHHLHLIHFAGDSFSWTWISVVLQSSVFPVLAIPSRDSSANPYCDQKTSGWQSPRSPLSLSFNAYHTPHDAPPAPPRQQEHTLHPETPSPARRTRTPPPFAIPTHGE